MRNDGTEPLLGTRNFRVLIGPRETAFSEVSRLTSTTDFPAQSEPVHRTETVVLRRAVTDSKDLYTWRRRIVDGHADRRTVTIELLDRPGGPVTNAWQLVQAWPCRWSGPAFDARGSYIAMEEIELVFDDLVWLERTAHGAARAEAPEGG
jgi:phage tail-like protein